jgi:phage-related minor tail protein
VSVVIFRLSPVLPARAIGEFLTLRDVWQATRGTTGAIVAIVIIFLVLQMVMQLVAAIMAAILAPLGILAAYGVAVFSGLLAASLLTSFYGHFIEGRALR